MRAGLATRLLVAGAIPACVVVAAVLSLHVGGAALREAADERATARQDDAVVTQVEKDVLDLETGLRGFIITGSERFLQPWRQARARLPRDLAALRRRVDGGPAEREHAATLAQAARSYLRDFTEPLVASARAGSVRPGSETTAEAGKRRVDAIRRSAAAMRGDIDARARRRSASADEIAGDASRLGIVALTGSAVLLLLFAVYLIRRVAIPVRRVGAAADALAAGDLDARAPPGGAPELAQLGRSFNRLAARIAEQREEMQTRNRELRAAGEEADRANRAKSEFLSRMSHELRTPLNAILGFAQLLALDPLDAHQSEGVAQITRGGRHLLELIDEVLDIARVETGELRLSPEAIEASDVVAETLQLVGPLAERRSIRLVTDFGTCAAIHVMADRQRLKQVLLNLLSNAIKYNREAGEVRISLQREDDEHLAIRVADTGAGLSGAQLAQLFEPFQRLGAEQSGVEGTGLGLALSQRLAEAMGGRLEATSAPGAGSTFSVLLCTVAAPGPADEQLAHAFDPTVLGGCTILYIEDNLSNLRLVELVLGRHSEVTFLPAMQGNIGLELARQHRPDIVVLDLHLPDLRGDEVLIRLKAEPTTRDTPVIMLSADASPGQIRRLRDAGAAAYLTKPIDLDALVGAVGSCLGLPAADGA